MRFLKIARDEWPKLLDERNKIEPVARRDLLIAAETKRLAARHAGPVIAAGSTGSMPATAELIATIAKLPHGAVVLPGLDTDLDAPSWDLIQGRGDPPDSGRIAPAVGHPQFAMAALLRRIGIAREEVAALGPPSPHGRERLVSEALRPAAATDHWQANLSQPDFVAHEARALASLSVIEAANADEEALAIAVALREVTETKDKTAALITPDRALARRVLAALARWKVPVDDSGGDTLPATPAGVFARLVVDAAFGGLAPVALLGLLKHPLLRLNAHLGAHTAAIETLERAVFRGPRPRAGTEGLQRAFATFRDEFAKFKRREPSDLHRSDPRVLLTERELDAAAAFVAQLTAVLRPLEQLATAPHPFAEIAARHRDAVAELSADRAGTPAAFAGTAGEVLAAAFDEIALDQTSAGFAIDTGDYADLFERAIADRTVRRPGLPGVRVRDLRPARGAAAGHRPCRARRVGRRHLAAGDARRSVAEPSDAACARARSAGAADFTFRPRFRAGARRQRGDPQLCGEDFRRADRHVALRAAACRRGRRGAMEGGTRARRALRPMGPPLDQPAQVKRTPKPEPKPPRDARPVQLSVTEIEAWLRDPYTIYAKHILRLRELDPIDLPPGAADRGTIIHGAVGDFTRDFAAQLPDDPVGKLIEFGSKHFATLEDYPEARAFWLPRFLRIARWFAAWDTERRKSIQRCTPKSTAPLRFRWANAHSSSARAPTGSSVTPVSDM